MKKTCLIWLGVVLLCGRVLAIDEDGWFDSPDDLASIADFSEDAVVPIESGSEQHRGGEGNFADAITPEIHALARGLDNDPKKIFDYVHNHIDFVPYFGSKKGAQLTLLERSGNDWDQSALLVALLRDAGYDASYQFGRMLMLYSSATNNQNLTNWLGLAKDTGNFTSNATLVANLLTTRGYRATLTSDPGIGFDRTWVLCTISNVTYSLDPSFKVYTNTTGIDWATAVGINRSNLLAAAGGTTNASPDYVVSLNETNLNTQLVSYATNFLSFLRNEHPNASVEEIMGSRRIVEEHISSLSNAMPFTLAIVASTNGQFSAIPTAYMSQIRVQFGNVNHVIYMPELQGQRLSLTFDNTNGVLWLDDTVRAQETNGSGSSVAVTLSIDHPHTWAGNNLVTNDFTGRNDQTFTTTYRRTVSGRVPRYALIYSFEPSPDLLRKRQEQLDSYLALGFTNGSRQVVTETLNVMGLNWLLQSTLDYKLVGQQRGMLFQRHHAFGRMAQEESYFVDVNMIVNGYFQNTGDSAKRDQHAVVAGYLASAMEHGVVEQMQAGNNDAISTIKMVHVSNQRGDRLYRATSANWSAIQSQLQGYTSTQVQEINKEITNGAAVLLPRKATNVINQWSGMAYASRTTNGLKMIITGGYNGGYNTYWAELSYDPVFQAAVASPSYFSFAPATTYSWMGADPVSMADGALTLDTTDLSLGQSEPRGLRFSRFYNSRRRNHNLVKLGYGWTHNYDIRASEQSDIQAGIGLATPAEMAAFLVTSRAALEVYTGATTAKELATTALIAKWGVDQLRSNAVSVVLGNDTVQFIKQPNNSYTAPAGVTMTLSRTNAKYILQHRHGNVFQFDASNRIEKIVDQYTKELAFTYTNNLVKRATDAYGRYLDFTYSGTNSLTSVSSSVGATVSFSYGNNNLTNATDPESKSWPYVYDANHQLLANFNSLDQLIVTNLYDEFARVIEQRTGGDTNKTWRLYYTGFLNTEEDPAGGRRQFSYDDRHRSTGVQDALGNSSQAFYDGQDHVVMTVSPSNETNRFEFDGRHNRLRSIDALNFTNQFLYDGQDNLIRTVDARGSSNLFAFNAKFQLTGSTNATGDWTTFAYNATDGTLTSRTDLGGTTTYGYDSNGQLNLATCPGNLGSEGYLNNTLGDVLIFTNARGFVTSFQYNQRRELTNTIAPTNLTVKVVYDAVGNVLSATDARGFSVSNTWSATRKLLATVLPATPQGVPTVTNVYDGRDWLVRTINPLSQSATNLYDAAGRILGVTDPLLRTMKFGYDADGRWLATTNAASEVSRKIWNARGELLQTTDPANRVVKRAYDATGNQITLTNRNGKKWQFQFDAANRLTNTITPLGRETRITYDARGLLSTVREPSTQTATNFYDAKGRLTNRTDTVAATLFRYDANNNVTNVVESGKTNAWTYDAYDRVSAYHDADGNQLQYRYDANGNLTNLIYPGNRTVTYAYDSLNRLTNVTDWASRQTRFTYDLASQLTSIIRPNGTQRIIYYDAAGQTTNIVEKMAIGVPIAFFKLNWNNAARAAWEFAAPLPHAYTPPGRTNTFDDDNRLATFNGNNVVHDTDGNMTIGPLTNNTSISYTYNARNRLLSAGGMDYAYDPAGNRVALTNGTNVTRFVVNPNATLSQVLMRVKGGVTNYYIHGLGLLYEINETATSTNIATYHCDARGSTVALADSNGIPTDRMEYSPYATTTYRAGTNDTPFLYNGRYGVQTDPNGLLHMRARYYNPYLCRFLNADPSGFAGGLNHYAYANGNPVSMMDPFGLGAVGVAAGGSWLDKAFDWVGNALLGPVDYGDGSVSFNHDDFASGADSYFEAVHQEAVRREVGEMAVTTAASLIPYERVVGALLGTTERAAVALTTGTQVTKSEVTALTKFYPENAGFAGATERTFLMPGQTIDRYGGSGVSRFFSPQGTADWRRSLPPGTTGQPLRTFEVVKPFEVESGTIAPWFNQPGGGLQYRSPVKLEILLKRGIIKEVTP